MFITCQRIQARPAHSGQASAFRPGQRIQARPAHSGQASAIEQVLGLLQGGFAVAVTSNHAGQGLFSLLRVKNRKGGAGLMVVDFFGDMPMSITQGGDLGEVGNENNLLVASHFRFSPRFSCEMREETLLTLQGQ